MYRLENQILRYAWGSETDIANLLGIDNPTHEPMAELWMGAHPKAPSFIPDLSSSLSGVISSNPEGMLGTAVATQYENALPFLFKVLAAGRALSIQAHPNKRQAQEGWERENNQGVPLDDPSRSYHDDNHKPEIICAVSDFWALRGFRLIGEIVRDLEASCGPVGAELSAVLKGDGLRVFFETYLTLSDHRKKSLVSCAVDSARRRQEPRYRWIEKLAGDFPEDIGVVCPIILNLVKLAPGQAMYLDAGELHAYLSGLGMELMANSDNVLRGGLTPKNIDIPELMRVLTFRELEPEILVAQPAGACLFVYETASREFRLSAIRVDETCVYRAPDARSVEILFCLDGNCVIETARGPFTVAKGQSVFVPAMEPGYVIRGRAELYRATVPA